MAALTDGVELRVGGEIPAGALAALYEAVGWAAYVRDPDALARAVSNSTYVVTAWEDDRLVGLARGLSDEVAIFYLQDILVRPDWQGQGVGRALLAQCLDRFSHVRQIMLLTDDEPRQRAFYEAMGLTNARELGLNAFVRINSVTPE